MTRTCESEVCQIQDGNNESTNDEIGQGKGTLGRDRE